MIEKFIFDYIYQTCVFNFFMSTFKTDIPHFELATPSGKNEVVSLEHFVIQAKMNMRMTSALEKNYGLDTHEAFLDSLIVEARLNLDNYFINYLEKHIYETENLSFKKLNEFDRFVKYIEKNLRVRLGSKKRDRRLAPYISGIINEFVNKYSDFLMDKSRLRLLVSPDIGIILKGMDQFVSNISIDGRFIHSLGSFSSLRGSGISVFVDPKLLRTMYFAMGPLNPPTLFFSTNMSTLTEHNTLPNFPSDIEKVYRMNLYHTIFAEEHFKTKKIIFDND